MSTDAWDQAKDTVERHAAAGGIFVKLTNDGDKVSGVFIGEPHVREVVWTGERYELFSEDTPKHKGKRTSLRLATNFYVPAEGAMKVIEFNATATRDVLKMREKYGFRDWTFEIERNGGPNDPKTRFRILPDEKITDGLRADMDDIELHDLRALLSGDDDQDDDADSKAAARRGPADTTVDANAADELLAALKALGPEAGRAFLKKFGIARIRELKARDLKAARAFIQSLQPKSDETDVDPFA